MTQFKTSKLGKNVLTEINPDNLIFDGLKNSFKIISQGILNYTIPAESNNEVTTSIAHYQTIKPFVFSFIKWSDGLVSAAGGSKKGSLVGNDQIYNSSFLVEKTNITWGFQSFSASDESVTMAYIICEAPIQ